MGLERKMRKQHRKTGSHKKSKIQQTSGCATRFGIACCQGTSSRIIHHISISYFFLSPAKSVAALLLPKIVWRHATFPGYYCRAPVLFPKHRISDYYHCLPSDFTQKACQFESILSCRLQKSRAMFSNEMPELAEGSSVCKRHSMSWATFRSLPLFQLCSVVCNVCSALGRLCAAMCKLTLN